MTVSNAEARRIASFKAKMSAPELRILQGLDDAAILRLTAILEAASAAAKIKRNA